MQQVGAKSILASFEAVDPSRLPDLFRTPGQRALVNLRHTWVLHKRGVLRGAGIILLLAGLIAAYETRDGIGAGAQSALTLLEGRFADAGFGIKAINITGQTLTSENDILKALAIEPRISTLNFDAEAARARLEALPTVAHATVRKVYPGHVEVTVTEREPVARWRVDGVTFLVDGNGEQIAADTGAYVELPLVVGDGAADDALVMIKAIERFDKVKEGLAALSRIGDRRWDLIYYTGLRVQMPELGVGQALKQLQDYAERYKLLDRDITQIDLRVAGIVAVKPTEFAAKQLAEAAKARMSHTDHHAVDPSYETPAEIATGVD